MVSRYMPSQGDIISLDFDPQAGRERRGRRPALVVSGDKYIKYSNLAIVCPITNTNRKYPLHLPLAGCQGISGFIMIDQIRSVDFAARQAAFIEKCPVEVMARALGMIEACFK